MFNILVNVVGDYEENSYIGYIEESGSCFIVDPGDEPQRIIDSIEKRNFKLKFILVTHGHMDHINAVDKIVEKYNVPVYMSNKDYRAIKSNTPVFGTMHSDIVSINEGDTIDFEGIKIDVIETPGHTQGGVCFKIGNVLFSGDTLFKTSIGRSDLPGGDFGTLISSVRNKLMILDDNTIVLPGHSDKTTIAYEKNNNPYVR